MIDKDDWLLFRVRLKNKTNRLLHTGTISLRIGFDCYMESYPEWNSKLFPTLLRCEQTHFWGYLPAPDGRILGLSCAQPIASYRLVYNQTGHRIYTVMLDLFQSLKTPDRYPSHCSLLPGEERQWEIHAFPVLSLNHFAKALQTHLPVAFAELSKYTVEPGERILPEQAIGISACFSPNGSRISPNATAFEPGIYRIVSEQGKYRSESLVYCRKRWSGICIKLLMPHESNHRRRRRMAKAGTDCLPVSGRQSMDWLLLTKPTRSFVILCHECLILKKGSRL